MGKKLVKNSPSEFYLEFDLVELFNSEVTDDIAVSFGQSVIDKILQRTSNGRRVDGSSFKHYSEDYSESLEFQAAGKDKSSPDLELSGGMLADMDILEASPRRVKIGFTDPTEMAKAYNHHTGDTLPERPFFDLNKSELDALIKDFAPSVEDSPLAIDPSIFSDSPTVVQQEAARRISLLDLLDEMEGGLF